MVLCLKCAEAVTSMLLGKETLDGIQEWFLESFHISQQRLETVFEGRRNQHAPPEPLETRSHV